MRENKYNFYVYIMSNFNRNCFYIGFTNDIVRRIIEHKYGFGSNFTAKYKLKFLVYYEYFQYAYNAINREKELKKWRREKKIALIKSGNVKMRDLSEELFKECCLSDNDVSKIAEELKRSYNNP